MRIILCTLLLSCTSLAGCKHTQSSKPLPAIIEQTTATMKAEIQQAIVSLKGGVAPLLPDTIFKSHSELLLEHGRSTDDIGNSTLGAHSLTVQRFVLQLRETGCVLFYPKTAQFVLLKSVSCQPMVE